MKDITEKRQVLGITQLELADLLNISHEHMNRIEKGKRTLTDRMKSQIDSIFEFYETELPLTVSFDYVRVRFKTTNYQDVIENMLGMKVQYFYYEDYGFYKYKSRLVYGNMVVMFNEERKELGVLLEMSGRGCRQFEYILSKQNRSWFDFFNTSVKNNAVMKRLDLAIDDKVGFLHIPTLVKKRHNGEYISHLKKGKRTDSIEGEDYLGSTLDLGTRKSKVHICMYEKNYEQYEKYGINPDVAEVKNRIEIRLRAERADKAIKVIISAQEIESATLDIINSYIVFIEPDSIKDKRRWKINPRWKLFIGLGRKKLKLTTKPEAVTLEKTKKWIAKQVAPSLKMLQIIEEEVGVVELADMIENAELTKKQRALVEQEITAVNEVIKWN